MLKGLKLFICTGLTVSYQHPQHRFTDRGVGSGNSPSANHLCQTLAINDASRLQRLGVPLPLNKTILTVEGECKVSHSSSQNSQVNELGIGCCHFHYKMRRRYSLEYCPHRHCFGWAEFFFPYWQCANR